MELLRRVARALMRSDSALYRMASSGISLATITIREGPLMVPRLSRLSQASPGEPQPVKFKSLKYPIYIRPGTPDAKTIINNIIREDYGFVAPSVPPSSMIDAGAYIGDTSAYFLSKYPNLRIAAFEPDPNNYEIARQNLRPYGDRVRLFNEALSSRSGTVFISNSYEGARISNSGVEIEATTIPAIMAVMGWEHLSILKMDIEGEEVNVLDEKADAWLKHVGLLIVETHGSHVESKVRQTLERNGFYTKQFRACWFCVKES